MSNALLLLPDFLLIVLGFVLCHRTALNRPVWEAAEKLVYYLLFPVLLFNSILKSPLQPAQTVSLAAAAVGTVAVGVLIAFAIGRWPGVGARLHNKSRQAIAAAPAPEQTSLIFAISLSTTRRPLRIAALAIIAVPCWSS